MCNEYSTHVSIPPEDTSLELVWKHVLYVYIFHILIFLIFLNLSDLSKSTKTLVFREHTHMFGTTLEMCGKFVCVYAYIHMYIYICMYIYIYVYTYRCV